MGSLYLPLQCGSLLLDHLDEQYFHKQQAVWIPRPSYLNRIGQHIHCSRGPRNVRNPYKVVYLTLELQGYTQKQYL